MADFFSSIINHKYRGKEIGIILNYLVLLVGLYAWDLSPFIVLLSFMCEYGVVIVITAGLTLFVGKSWILRVVSAAEVFFSGFAIAAFQGLLIFLLANDLSASLDHLPISNLPLTVLAVSVPMFVFHLLPLRYVKDPEERMVQKRTVLFVIAISFLVMLSIGLLMMDIAEPSSMTPVMAWMLVGRMLLEIYMNHYLKEKPRKLSKP